MKVNLSENEAYLAYENKGNHTSFQGNQSKERGMRPDGTMGKPYYGLYKWDVFFSLKSSSGFRFC